MAGSGRTWPMRQRIYTDFAVTIRGICARHNAGLEPKNHHEPPYQENHIAARPYQSGCEGVREGA
jgi:hypothetical protein